MAETQELKPQEKMEVATPVEQTKPGPVFTPNVDIFETEKEITLLADVPGVKSEDLGIDLKDNMLTLTGEVKPANTLNGEEVLTEYQVGSYYRQFTLTEIIDQAKIEADLKNGVLRLTLPKVERALPRRITVNAR
jgi:HSP20 family molecular chaperone IbpA